MLKQNLIDHVETGAPLYPEIENIGRLVQMMNDPEEDFCNFHKELITKDQAKIRPLIIELAQNALIR